MSADNGIYILKTPTDYGVKYLHLRMLVDRLDRCGADLVGMPLEKLRRKG
jgi:hypothetical protein